MDVLWRHTRHSQILLCRALGCKAPISEGVSFRRWNEAWFWASEIIKCTWQRLERDKMYANCWDFLNCGCGDREGWVRASWAVVPGCTETFGLVLYISSLQLDIEAPTPSHLDKPRVAFQQRPLSGEMHQKYNMRIFPDLGWIGVHKPDGAPDRIYLSGNQREITI